MSSDTRHGVEFCIRCESWKKRTRFYPSFLRKSYYVCGLCNEKDKAGRAPRQPRNRVRSATHNILRALRRWERRLGSDVRVTATRRDIETFLQTAACTSEASGRTLPLSNLRVVRRKLDLPVDLDSNAVVLSTLEAARHLRGVKVLRRPAPELEPGTNVPAE